MKAILFFLLFSFSIAHAQVTIKTDSAQIQVDSIQYPLIISGGNVKYKVVIVSIPPPAAKNHPPLWIIIPSALLLGYIIGRE